MIDSDLNGTRLILRVKESQREDRQSEDRAEDYVERQVRPWHPLPAHGVPSDPEAVPAKQIIRVWAIWMNWCYSNIWW